MLKTNKKTGKEIWLNENRLKKLSFLIWENFTVSEKELEECKRILENVRRRSQSFSS